MTDIRQATGDHIPTPTPPTLNKVATGNRKYRFGCLGCLTLLVASPLCLVLLDILPYFQYHSRHDRMLSLVRVGMDIDEASDILRSNGFKPGAKYHPTAPKDYYWVDVRLISRHSLIMRALGKKHYVYGCLEAGLDDVVRKVM